MTTENTITEANERKKGNEEEKGEKHKRREIRIDRKKRKTYLKVTMRKKAEMEDTERKT
jgi:hypothetical protein